MNRRSLLSAIGAALGAAAPRPRPNVLLIISDQFHHASYGAAGHSVVKTPNLNRMAREGVRFENAVCVTPFCSPTRASLLTGLYPHKHGITYNVDYDGDQLSKGPGFDPGMASTEQILFENGYTCRHFGKWHLGDRSTLPPYADEPSEGTYSEGPRKNGAVRGPGGAPVHMIDAVQKANANWEGPLPANTKIGRIDTPPAQIKESKYTDLAIRELDKLAGKPFFLTVSLSAPHAPFQVSEPYYSMHERAAIALPANRNSIEPVDRKSVAWRFGQSLGEDGMREYMAVYYGLIAMVDWNIGRLLDAVHGHGLDRDTLVIFTSDHGDMCGGHGAFDKAISSMYEEITRIPLIMRMPATIPAGGVVKTQSGTCDVHPTILDYLSLKPRGPVHGMNLRPYIQGKADSDRPIFCERERGEKNFQRMIRTLEWKYVYNSSGESQLYNLMRDPGETKNLIADASARPARDKLHRQLGAWMRDTGDPRIAQLGTAPTPP